MHIKSIDCEGDLMGKKEYAYFFIDLYNSRWLFGEDQKLSNSILKELAKHLNKRFSIRLLSNFEVREGDGVLGGTEDLSLIVDIYESCLDFKETQEFKNINLDESRTEALKFYFGVGIGNITTGEDTYDLIHDINGTAISNAKEASNVAKDIILYNSLPKREIPNTVKESIDRHGDYYYRWQDFQLYIVTDDYLSKLLNPTFYLAYEKYVSNEQQNKLFQLRKKYPNLDLYIIGEKLGYGESNSLKNRQKLSIQVSNLLNKSNFKSQKHVLKDIEMYLRRRVY